MYTTLNTLAHKILPQWIYSHLIGNWSTEGLKKYSTQTIWLFIAKIFSFGLSFFMVAIVARYLGPENLGRLGYAQSFIAIFSLFASLGISQIVARDLTAHPEREHEILGTAFYLKAVFGVLTTILAGAVAYFTSTDPILTWLILIISLTFLIQPFGVAGDIFTARVKGKYTAYSQIILTSIIQALKLLIILLGKGILFFAGILVLEALIGALLSIYFYIKVFQHNPLKWQWDTSYAKTLTLISAPLLFAGVSSYLFGQIDKVMLQPMQGSVAVGIYGSAVTITQILGGFLPGVIFGALVPALINAHKTDIKLYYHRLRTLIFLTGGIAALVSLVIFLFAPYIIHIIYGAEFAKATPVLRIFIWTTVLGTLVAIANQHLIIENKTKLFLVISIITAIINIVLNYTLIPLFSMHGAAIATLISFASYIGLVATLQRLNTPSNISPSSFHQ